MEEEVPKLERFNPDARSFSLTFHDDNAMKLFLVSEDGEVVIDKDPSFIATMLLGYWDREVFRKIYQTSPVIRVDRPRRADIWMPELQRLDKKKQFLFINKLIDWINKKSGQAMVPVRVSYARIGPSEEIHFIFEWSQ